MEPNLGGSTSVDSNAETFHVPPVNAKSGQGKTIYEHKGKGGMVGRVGRVPGFRPTVNRLSDGKSGGTKGILQVMVVEGIDDLLCQLVPESVAAKAGSGILSLWNSQSPKNPDSGFSFGINKETCDFALPGPFHSNEGEILFLIRLNQELNTLQITDTSKNGIFLNNLRIDWCHPFLHDTSNARKKVLTHGHRIKYLNSANLEMVFAVVTTREQSFQRKFVPKRSYLLLDLLGKGAFGNVYKAVDRTSSEIIALKRFDTKKERSYNWVRDEARIHTQLHHVRMRHLILVLNQTDDLRSTLFVSSVFFTITVYPPWSWNTLATAI